MKYPNGKHINEDTTTKTISYDNRGMNLEEDINITNEYYQEKNIAFIYKKPTPIQITKTDYKHGKITEAFFKQPSTTDYNGLYKGYYIDFEAKETKSKTSFPLSNIHPHQIKHIKNIVENGGIGFLIVSFTLLNKVYLLQGTKFINYISHTKKASIPISYFEKEAYIIPYTYMPRIDYIKIIDQLIGGTNEKQKK